MTDQRKQSPSTGSPATTYHERVRIQRPRTVLGRLQQPTMASQLRSVQQSARRVSSPRFLPPLPILLKLPILPELPDFPDFPDLSALPALNLPVLRDFPDLPMLPSLGFSRSTGHPGPIEAVKYLAKSSLRLLQGPKEPDPRLGDGIASILQDRECASCANTHPHHRFPVLEGCDHTPDICQDCMEEWIANQIETVVWNRIGCPSSGCTRVVSYEIVREYASIEVFAG
jgi:hypothetical protein